MFSFVLLAILDINSLQARVFTVDDSYTVAARFAKYSKKEAKLIEPELVFAQGQKVYFDRVYQSLSTRDLHLDVFLPIKSNHQAIVMVHGGGWRSGNKSHFYALANVLAKKGYTLILPEYRLSIEAPYPAGLEDINQAIEWTKKNAKNLNIDPTKIAIAGGSSGGHMAALIGFTQHLPLFKPVTPILRKPSRLNAIIDLDGVLDLTDPETLKHENKKKDKSAFALWIGGSWQNANSLWRQASPAEYISQDAPPLLVISSGQKRFTQGRERVFNQLTALNIPTRLHEFDQVIHTFWLFDPYLTLTAKVMDEFLQSEW